MLKILFVCTGNTCRSPMAEALFKRELAAARLPFQVMSGSAGISAFPGQTASGPALRLLADEGINSLKDHLSKAIDNETVEDADIILVMTAAQHHQLLSLYPHLRARVFLLKEFAGHSDQNADIEDPFGFGFEKYQQVLEDIRVCVKKIIHKLREGSEDADCYRQ